MKTPHEMLTNPADNSQRNPQKQHGEIPSENVTECSKMLSDPRMKQARQALDVQAPGGCGNRNSEFLLLEISFAKIYSGGRGFQRGACARRRKAGNGANEGITHRTGLGETERERERGRGLYAHCFSFVVCMHFISSLIALPLHTLPCFCFCFSLIITCWHLSYTLTSGPVLYDTAQTH